MDTSNFIYIIVNIIILISLFFILRSKHKSDIEKIKAEEKARKQERDYCYVNEINDSAKQQLEEYQKTIEERKIFLRKELENKEIELNLEFEKKSIQLENDFNMTELEITEKIKQEKMKLKSIEDLQNAATNAIKKEKEIQEQKDFYCLNITEEEKKDIEILSSIKNRLAKPRILSMLIWSTYFQKKMTALCNNVVGTRAVCGIYKITNQKNNMCYIGQAVDISKRWKNHAKAGLGIDTPVGNKLYQAMQDDGIYSFSWEVLTPCEKEELNSKEKYFIKLYQAYEYGYNSNQGNRGV